MVEVGGKGVAIRAGWAAFDRPLMVAGTEGSVLPRSVVGHRAFDAKEPLVVIGDDQEERFGGWGVKHGGMIARFLYMIKDIIIYSNGTGGLIRLPAQPLVSFLAGALSGVEVRHFPFGCIFCKRRFAEICPGI
jgi:hypothetical protein